MTIQDSERPRGQHEDARHRKQDPHDFDHELAPLVLESRQEHVDEQRREQDPEQSDRARDGEQQAEHRARHAAGFFRPALAEQLGVDGDERCAQRAFAEEVLEHIRQPEARAEDVGMQARSEVGCHHALAHEPRDSARENAGGDEDGAWCQFGPAAEVGISNLPLSEKRFVPNSPPSSLPWTA